MRMTHLILLAACGPASLPVGELETASVPPPWRPGVALVSELPVQTLSLPGAGLFGASLVSTELDGDRWPDLIVGDHGNGFGPSRLHAFRGRPIGVHADPVATFEDPQGACLACDATEASDVDGDGWSDLFYDDAHRSNVGGVMYQIQAGPQALDGVFDASREGPPHWAYWVRSLGDVDGDGFDDLAVSANLPVDPANPDALQRNHWELYAGGLGGLSAHPVGWIDPVGPTATLQYALAAGDFDGDGFADVVVSEWDAWPAETGRVHGHRGGVGGLDPDPAFVWETSTDRPIGHRLANAGDLDRDGDDELLMTLGRGGQGPGNVRVHLGTPDFLEATPSEVLVPPDVGRWNTFGSTMAGVGDLDQDGYPDVAIADPTGNDGHGRVFLYAGSPTGLDPDVRHVLRAPALGGRFGDTLTGLGGMTVDGFGGVWIASDTLDPDGEVYLYVGAFDRDGDGFASPEDCDDRDPEVHPGAEDLPNDGKDADCDGEDEHEEPGDDTAVPGESGLSEETGKPLD